MATDRKQLFREYTPYPHRTKSFYNPDNGNYYSELSGLHTLGSDAQLLGLLEACDTHTVYVLREHCYSLDEYLQVQGLSIINEPDALYRANIEYKGKQVHLLPVHIWLEVPAEASLSDCVKVMRVLTLLLNADFEGAKVPVELLDTPAMSGVELLKRALPFEGKGNYTHIPADIEHIIMTNFGQGRVETFYHGTDRIEHAYCYDGKFFYAACTYATPIGAPVHDTGSEYVPFVPAFYRVHVQVPEQWHHIGLLPVRVSQRRGKEVVMYPNTPLQTFDTWCTDREYYLATQNNWHIEIAERILFPDSEKAGKGAKPFKNLTDKLVRLYQYAEQAEMSQIQRRMLQRAFRKLLLHTIGTLHRGSVYIDEYAEDMSSLPDGIIEVPHYDTDGRVRVKVKAELSERQMIKFLPHWSAYLWSLARVRLAKYALEVPYESIIAIRSDALWLSAPHPFKDTGKVGELVVKPLKRAQGLQWPTHNGKGKDGVLTMIRIARGQEE